MAQDENKNKVNPLEEGSDLGKTPEENLVQPEKKEEKKDKKDKNSLKDNEIAVSKDLMDKLLKRLDILEEAADKGRLERVTALKNQSKNLIKKVSLSTYDGRVIIGWKSIKDDVFFDREGKLHEDQVVAVYFHNGKKDSEGKLIPEAELSIQSFARLTKKLECEIVSESKDREGNTTLVVVDKDGREITIGLDFINAS